jgi:hypothetical protein
LRANRWLKQGGERAKQLNRKWQKTWRDKNPGYFRANWLNRAYGMTVEDHDRLLAEQGGQCAICRRIMDKPNVDHDHQTNTVRGLLCNNCNLAIGLLQDDALVVEAAALYLRRNQCQL